MFLLHGVPECEGKEMTLDQVGVTLRKTADAHLPDNPVPAAAVVAGVLGLIFGDLGLANEHLTTIGVQVEEVGAGND